MSQQLSRQFRAPPNLRPRAHSAELASLRYDIKHSIKDGDDSLPEPKSFRPETILLRGQDGSNSQSESPESFFLPSNPKPSLKQFDPNRKHRFAPRKSGLSELISSHLDHDVLLTQVLPALNGEDEEYWFGFSEFTHFTTIDIVSQAIEYIVNNTLTPDLIDTLFLPVIEERMDKAYPSEERYLLPELINFAKRHVWDTTNVTSDVQIRDDQNSLAARYPLNESVIGRFIRESRRVRNDIRERLIRCHRLLQLVENSRRIQVWTIPVKLRKKDSRVYLPVVASTPIQGDFSMYLRQLFLSRQLALTASQRNVEVMDRVEVAKLDVDGFLKHTADILTRFREHYSSFSYFINAYNHLSTSMDMDFERTTGMDTISLKFVGAWIEDRMRTSDYGKQDHMKTFQELLMAHIVDAMGKRWYFPTRSKSSFPLKLVRIVPIVTEITARRRRRREKAVAAIEKKMLAEPGLDSLKRLNKEASKRDASPIRQSERRVEGEPGVFLRMVTSSKSSSGSGGSHGLYGSSSSEQRPSLTYKQPRSVEIDANGVEIQRKKGRPRGSKNKPKQRQLLLRVF